MVPDPLGTINRQSNRAVNHQLYAAGNVVPDMNCSLPFIFRKLDFEDLCLDIPVSIDSQLIDSIDVCVLPTIVVK